MKEKTYIDQPIFLEGFVNFYMQSLLLESPEQVLCYFEKQVNKYISMLKQRSVYPKIVIVSIQHLIEDYSLYILHINEYIKYKREKNHNHFSKNN